MRTVAICTWLIILIVLGINLIQVYADGAHILTVGYAPYEPATIPSFVPPGTAFVHFNQQFGSGIGMSQSVYQVHPEQSGQPAAAPDGSSVSRAWLTSGNQVVTAQSGEGISISISYQIWQGDNPSELDQLMFIASWTPSWSPPSDYYWGIYNGVPPSAPGTSDSTSFSLTAPRDPGTYYLWFVWDANYGFSQAAADFSTPVRPPAYIEIDVNAPSCQYGGTYPNCNPAPTCQYGGTYPNCNPPPSCQYGGTYPNCNPPPSCQYGGTYPNCNPPPSCQYGGTYPNCNPPPSCQYGGTYPNCNPPPSCQYGGTYPNCNPPPSCQYGGTYPNCNPPPSCQYGGTYPNCNPQRSSTDKWALVVGINDYGNWIPCPVPGYRPNLCSAVKDANDFRNLLVNQFGFPASHVELLTDNWGLTSDTVDKNSILGGLSWLGQSTDGNSMVVIYVSGHGAGGVVSGSNGQLIIPSYIVPHAPQYLTSNYISQTEFFDQAARIKYRQLVVILDTSWSGGFVLEAASRQLKNTLVISACAWNQDSSGVFGTTDCLDSPLPFGNGKFTAVFIPALKALDGKVVAAFDKARDSIFVSRTDQLPVMFPTPATANEISLGS